jgi:hypothetical protein
MPCPRPRYVVRAVVVAAVMLQAMAVVGPVHAAGPWWKRGYTTRGVAGGVPQKQAPYEPGESPYVAKHSGQPKYFMPPTQPRTPTWKMYGTPEGLVPGNFPSYAPMGFGGYRFPAVGNQAYR